MTTSVKRSARPDARFDLTSWYLVRERAGLHSRRAKQMAIAFYDHLLMSLRPRDVVATFN